MELSEVKIYLSTRINSKDLLLLSDSELQKYFDTAYMLLNTFYEVSEYTQEVRLIPVIGEEMLFLYFANIDLNLFYQYEGLKQFSVEGAIAGQVAYDQVGDLFSRVVRGMLQALGIDSRIEDPDAKIKNTYTWL